MWQIDYKGATLREPDVTLGQVSLVNKIVGDSGWDVMDPASSPDTLGAWCTVALTTTGVEFEIAAAMVANDKIVDLLQSISGIAEEAERAVSDETPAPDQQEVIDRLRTLIQTAKGE